jgi:hypothetical protein
MVRMGLFEKLTSMCASLRFSPSSTIYAPSLSYTAFHTVEAIN